MHTRPRALAALAVAVALAGSTAAVAAAEQPAAATPTATLPQALAPDTTDPAEAARVDGVTADIEWFDCSQMLTAGAQCGTVDLPIDYDEPDGPTTNVALVRIPAGKPAQTRSTGS